MRDAGIVLSCLGTALIVLKLTGHVDLSWWTVTAPMWVPVLCAVAVLTVCGLIIAAAALGSRR